MAYKYSINIRGNLEHKESIIRCLLSIGYAPCARGYIPPDSFNTLVVNAYAPMSGTVRNGEYDNIAGPANRDYIFNTHNQGEYDAALGIASIVDDDDFHTKEIFVNTNISSDEKVLQVTGISNGTVSYNLLEGEERFNSEFGKGSDFARGLRKATPDEIINHFKTKSMSARTSETATGGKATTVAATTGKDTLLQAIRPDDRKIIGYRTPFDMFGGDVKKGTMYGVKETFNRTHQFFVPQEIVQTWEPVYKEEEITLNDIGSRDRKVIIKKGSIYFWGRKGEIVNIDDLNKILTEIISNRNNIQNGKSLAGYEVRIDNNMRFLRVGCIEENNLFSINDLQNVKDAYDKLNNVPS